MCGVTAIAADTDAEARRLFSSLQQSFVALRTGHPGPLPPPVDDMDSHLDQQAKFMLGQALSVAAVGSPATIQASLAALVKRTGADELMITSSVFDHAARLRSYEIVAQAREALALAA
jgi:alkanesulfonate monooxygenase SsuD/methylene tetrahydromethanopterin reductase-like flavin-dependent oxidoreductase (luciferase family)